MRKTVHVIVSGRVQGVGYRAFTEREAKRTGLDGWVRNRADGTVEAVLSGEGATIEAVLWSLRSGPKAAIVTYVAVSPEPNVPPAGFTVLPTA